MNCKAGDIVVVETQTIYGKLIHKVQRRLNYTEEQAKGTHVLVCINSVGNILEAESDGIEFNNLKRYNKLGWKYHILRHNEADCDKIADMAIHLATNDKYERRNYDWLLISGLWLMSLGMPHKYLNFFNIKDNFICSEYVLEIFKQLNIIEPKEYKLYLPAEWLKWRDEGFFTEIT